MGMALDEPTEESVRLEANGISAFIDSDLLRSLEKRGNIYIEYGTDRFGMTGFSIAIKKNPSDKPGCDC